MALSFRPGKPVGPSKDYEARLEEERRPRVEAKDLQRLRENIALAKAAGNYFMIMAQRARVRGRLK